jgi:hypothetical protein
VLKALNKNPDDRYNGCGEFLGYLEAYEKSLRRQTEPDIRVPAKPTVIEPPFVEPSRRRPPKPSYLKNPVGAILLILLIVISSLYFFEIFKDDKPDPNSNQPSQQTTTAQKNQKMETPSTQSPSTTQPSSEAKDNPPIKTSAPASDQTTPKPETVATSESTTQPQPASTTDSRQSEKRERHDQDISADSRQEKQAQDISKPKPLDIYTEPITDMTFVYIEGGKYAIGCGLWTSDCYAKENRLQKSSLTAFGRDNGKSR